MKQQIAEFGAKMDKSINFYYDDLNSIRAGRANPAVLDKISVDYYGVPTPLTQIGNISVPEAHTLIIQPWDASILSEIEKAINKSDLGINPQSDGKVIRLNFPSLTEERRRDIAKSLHKKAEDAKVHIRSIRRDAIEFFKAQKKNSEITEDDLKTVEADVQKLTDVKIKEIETILSKKEKEILEV